MKIILFGLMLFLSSCTSTYYSDLPSEYEDAHSLLAEGRFQEAAQSLCANSDTLEKRLSCEDRVVQLYIVDYQPGSNNYYSRSTFYPRVYPAIYTGLPLCGENYSCYGDISNITGRPKTTYVRGYFRRNGTYVRSHYRSR